MFPPSTVIPSWNNQQYHKEAYNEASSIDFENGHQLSPEKQTILHAVQTWMSMGVPNTVLPILCKPQCREPLQTLLSASRMGFTLQPFLPDIPTLRPLTSDTFYGSRPSSSLSGSAQRAASMRSYDSQMSGDTLRSMGGPYGLTMHHDHRPIPETEEPVQNQAPLDWPEAGVSNDVSQNTSYPQSTMNGRHPQQQPAFSHITPVHDSQGSFYTTMLQDHVVNQNSFYMEDDADVFDAPDHNFHNQSLGSMQLGQRVGQPALYSLQPTTSKTQRSPTTSTDQTQRATRTEQVPEFNFWMPQEDEPSGYRSPCPFCERDFKATREFVAHMKANHDRPAEFLCLHTVPDRHGPKRCAFKTCRSSQLVRHHNEEHRGCTKSNTEGTKLPSCLEQIPNPRPKRVWGCWFCPLAFTTVDTWVSHHMQIHKFGKRRDMSYTWLMKSLLSQSALHSWWKSEVKKLEEETRSTWNIQWYAGQDLTRDELIKGLETGFWKDLDFTKDTRACRAIVAAAMKSTEQTRTELGPLKHSSRHASHGSSSTSMRPKSLRLPLRRSKSTLKQSTPDISGPIDHLPELPSRHQVIAPASSTNNRSDYSFDHSATVGAVHDNEIHMYLF
ncbi:hypothetical protein LTR70_005448 [Exophiala xenobiotica]|uniref:C2H2-type domain-containing protein n=1 Tax=Lithohypha guttulata TaxID=1690604 RepID=A0ABR0K9U9_9EURO|nr:hypothetical protein LTR24_005190 [Lithohypha guttulata]KAK5318426.1 hypothetical protein LTR70_005448 [Exophiala xenobiotica]